MRHQLRDAQQRKVKEAVLENLDYGSTFWLRDFAQKILPCRFWEGQKQYFGKNEYIKKRKLKKRSTLLRV